jgi:hypothetical protein
VERVNELGLGRSKYTGVQDVATTVLWLRLRTGVGGSCWSSLLYKVEAVFAAADDVTNNVSKVEGKRV